MLDRIEFKRADGPRIAWPSDGNDVPRTQHPSDCAVLQNNTFDELPKLPRVADRLFVAGMLGFALVSKKFS